MYDLAKQDCEWLLELRDVAIKHAKRVYGLSSQDSVKLYFHDIYSERLTTLHLHIKVNQAIHPHEKKQLTMLDDVIDWLQRGRDVKKLFIRKKHFFLDLNELDELTIKVGISARTIRNPFQLESQWLYDQ